MAPNALYVPQGLRGKLWKLFLRLGEKAEPGMYDQLVQRALGKTKYGRQVQPRLACEAFCEYTRPSAHAGCRVYRGFLKPSETAIRAHFYPVHMHAATAF